MKNKFLIICFLNLGVSFAEMHIYVALKPNAYFMGSGVFNPVTSSDSGLNQLMDSYNATFYEIGLSNCTDNQIDGSTTNGSQNLLNDLNNYDGVVDVAYPLTKYISGQFQQAYSVKIELLNPNIGNFVGMYNNVVTTNNNDLNGIFQTHNVFSYINNSIVSCTCDIDLLQTDLNNLNSLIVYTEFCSEAFLANEAFTSNKIDIFPNPFLDKFEIQTNENIQYYELFDVSGKQIFKSNSKVELDLVSQKWQSGVYFLKLTFTADKKSINKLIKM